jgi:RNA polymerase sigma-70 factor (ECF subfamily)
MPATRPSLLLRLRDLTDRGAWQQFVDVYAPLVDAYFRRRGVQSADAADLTQEVLEVVATGIARFEYDRRRGSFRGWLYAIARNKLHHFLAGDRRERGTGDSAAQQWLETLAAPEDEANWDREYEAQVFAWAAEQVRTVVDAATWEAFWQTAVEGRSGDDVATAMGMGIGAVYMAKSRVLARLRRLVDDLQGHGDEPGQ